MKSPEYDKIAVYRRNRHKCVSEDLTSRKPITTINRHCPSPKLGDCNVVEHLGGLNGAALLNLYLTEVMENLAECHDP